MNSSIIIFILAWVMKIEAASMLLPALVALIYREGEGFTFLACAIVFFVIGQFFSRKKPKDTVFYAKEGFLSVALCWVVLSLIGAIPFFASREIPSFIDAVFETASGFTTTGASILTDVEALSHCMLFWRSFTHWFGGMGILVFLLVILPMAGGQNIYLMKAESTGPSVGKLAPRVQKTAMTLYLIYSGMTVIQIVLLLIGGMPLFDSLCTAFGTAGTGGFGIKGDSFASYSRYLQVVVTVFMLLFGVNFNFYYLILHKRFKDAFSMEEVRWYFIIYAVVTLLIGVNLVLSSMGINPVDLFFTTSSIMTSTGFATADFDLWPTFSKQLLLMLMFIGACAGSTGGGMKVSRFIIWSKAYFKELMNLIHPKRVKILKMDGKAIDHDVIRTTNSYLVAFLVVFIASLMVISVDNYDFTTNFSAVATTLNNIGPGLAKVGPTQNFAHFSDLSKLVFTFDMLAGRLEVFPMLLLISPRTWKK